MKVAIYTLGCKVNQYETQAMEQELRRRGHQVVAFEEAADVYVVNSSNKHINAPPSQAEIA